MTTKKRNAPAVFEWPAENAGALPANRFQFPLGGETVSLPKMDFLPPEADDYLDTVAEQGLSRRSFILGLVAAIDEDLGAKLKAQRLERHLLNAFYDAWIAASEVEPGESSGSADT